VLGSSVPPLIEDLREDRGGRGGAQNPNAFADSDLGIDESSENVAAGRVGSSGAGSAHVMEGTQISLAAAKSVAKGCREFAASKGQTPRSTS